MEVKVRQSMNATFCILLPTPHSDLQQMTAQQPPLCFTTLQ